MNDWLLSLELRIVIKWRCICCIPDLRPRNIGCREVSLKRIRSEWVAIVDTCSFGEDIKFTLLLVIVTYSVIRSALHGNRGNQGQYSFQPFHGQRGWRNCLDRDACYDR